MTRTKCLLLTLFLAGIFISALLLPQSSSAVPSIARQTNMSCNMCHTNFGGPVPNFTMTGKKYRAFGYRTPEVRDKILSGHKPDWGERLNMPLLPYFTFRFQATLAQASKEPGSSDWSEVISDPTTRYAWFFTGPVGDHIGVWDEAYIVRYGSRQGNYAPGFAAWDELDLRYVFNPDNTETCIGLTVNNQGLAEICGFGPFPVDVGGGELRRASIGGEIHPRQMFAALYGWMNNRWVWQLGYNTGDTNAGMDKINAIGQFAYAFMNTNYNELWFNVMARSGSDVMPIVTTDFIPVCPASGPCTEDTRDYSFRDAIAGISGTRAAGHHVPYVAEDVNNATSVVAEARWSRQDMGPASFEAVLRYSESRERYNDNAKTTFSTVGAEIRLALMHTFYIQPFVSSTVNYEFTEHKDLLNPNPKKYEIDDPATVGAWLGFRPAENFLLNLNFASTQTLHLTEKATGGGRTFSVSLDYLF